MAGPLLLAALLAAVLAGCAATPQTRALTTERPDDLPPRAELGAVPFFAQERYQCGPAALAMILSDLGRDTAPDALVDEVYVPARQGSLRPEMRAAARARGLVAYPLAPDLHALLAEIAAGRPVLVMQNLGLSWAPRWHYAVAVGYDLPAREIILRSGTIRRRVTNLATFERTWARAERWAQVITPPDQPPATAEPLAWLSAVHELEATGRQRPARAGYRVATRQWPGTAPAWMARGNAAYGAGDYAEAQTAFRRAIALQPEGAGGWNNLAHALAASGCGSTAIAAARCAVGLSEDPSRPRQTLHEIQGRALESGPACGIPSCPDRPAQVTSNPATSNADP